MTGSRPEAKASAFRGRERAPSSKPTLGESTTVNTRTVLHRTGAPSTGDLRTDLDRAFEDARILVERVYREFYESGGPLEIERLFTRQRELPATGNVSEDLARDFAEVRILVNRVLREYHENGGFLRVEKLLEKHRGLPWYLLKSRGETTGSK